MGAHLSPQMCSWLSTRYLASCKALPKGHRLSCAIVPLQLFVSKGIVSAGEVRDRINLLESYGQNPMGPKLVARAWVDASFKARLLEDGMTAAQELGFSASGYPPKGGLNSK